MYKYFELKQDTGKPYILANESEKPEYTTVRDYPSALEYWKSKHVRIEFASDEEYKSVEIYLFFNNYKPYEQDKFKFDKKQGIPINHVEVKEVWERNEHGFNYLPIVNHDYLGLPKYVYPNELKLTFNKNQ